MARPPAANSANRSYTPRVVNPESEHGRFGAALLAGVVAGCAAFSAANAQPACLSAAERVETERELARNKAWLRAVGVLTEDVEAAVLFGWPLRAASGFTDPGYHRIVNFVDHDPGLPNQLLDYACGDRTIDTISGNHRGTDFLPWPFPWLKMQSDAVEVVAAAPGTIVLRQDGSFDQNCSCTGSWNAIFIEHADGSTAWYGHLKKDSLTPKVVGESVAAGEYLGLVGSSGCSTAPHLHFEVYDSADQLQDPFAGPCNDLNQNSWWLNQRPYHDSAINKIVHGLVPPMGSTGCAIAEQPNDQSIFAPGDEIYFTVYYRDTVGGQIITYRILRPDGSEQESFGYTIPTTSDTHSHGFQRTFPIDAASGIWRLTAEYEGRLYERSFVIGESPAGEADLLAVAKTATGVALTWTDSCGAPAARAGIHLGIIGDYYSHYTVGCDYTSGSATLTWLQVQGPRYFLVVPVSDNREGSYGVDSNGTERPASDAGCALQSIGCP